MELPLGEQAPFSNWNTACNAAWVDAARLFVRERGRKVTKRTRATTDFVRAKWQPISRWRDAVAARISLYRHAAAFFAEPLQLSTERQRSRWTRRSIRCTSTTRK